MSHCQKIRNGKPMFMFQWWGYCVRVKTYVSKSFEKSPRLFTLSAISVLFIPWSSWQFEWVRCHTVLALKFAAIVRFFLQWSGFLEWALSQSWQPLLFSFGLRTIAHLLQTRHFRTQLLPEIFNVKWIVVLLKWFSKFKWILFEKRPIFHLPTCRFFKSSANFHKVSFENGLHTKKVFSAVFSSAKG